MAQVLETATKETESLISGSEAIAVACKLADVDVITAYPIRPYDTVMQYVAKLVANGELDCEYIVAESEQALEKYRAAQLFDYADILQRTGEDPVVRRGIVASRKTGMPVEAV